MTTTKKELSYFRLKLEAYLGEHFPGTRLLASRSREYGKRSVASRTAFFKV